MPEFALRGVIPALLTPFDERGAVEWDLLRSQVERVCRAQVDALCVGGIASETAGSTPDELYKLCQAVVSASSRPVIGAIYPDSTVEALELGRAALSAGAVALLVAQPHYLFQPDPEGLEELFEALRGAFTTPLLLSNSLRTALVDLAAMQRLMSRGLVDGFHQAGGQAHLLADLLCLRLRLPVLSGVEDLLYIAFLLGAEGTVSSLAAVFPEECVELYAACRAGEHEKARAIHERLLRIWRVLDHPVEFVSRLKHAASVKGHPAGVPRSPYNWMPPESQAQVRRALHNEGKI
ncbi:MAG: dihydrodipicolinate synthase family protein [Acidobacteria bacterium]|nr:dihydrodipicolinate synthase family protein [Acidobacteriota bacterium]